MLQSKLEINKFYLLDNNSKFGTLVGINEPIKIKDHIWIQVGRSVLNFEFKKSFKWWWTCPIKPRQIQASSDLPIDYRIVSKYYPDEFQKYIIIK